ncbi:phospholipid phosphatase 3-like [Ptychodera flava]|uniref:phospholipid phosphatase 3-like n=1 Tax=Ptychodera flava TaxID=63121 RepID=UPI00396A5056
MTEIHCCHFILDLIIFLVIQAVVLIPIISAYWPWDQVHDYMELLMPLRNTGFRCEDVDIRYPRVPSFLPEFLDFKLLFYVKYGLLLIPIFGEIIFYCCYTRTRDRDVPECRPCFCYCHLIPVNIIKMIGYYITGLNMTLIAVIYIRTLVGRLRPNFWDTCQPDPTLYVCSQGWLYDDVCTGDRDWIFDAKISFPSEDTSTAFYAFTFIVMYIEARFSVWRGTVLTKGLLQVIFIGLAAFVGLTEIYDNYSYISDVIAGALLGMGAAYVVIYYMSSLFGSSRKRRRVKEDEIEMQTYIVTNNSHNNSNSQETSFVQQKL